MPGAALFLKFFPNRMRCDVSERSIHAAARNGGDHKAASSLEDYNTERARAQALFIQASMDRRRFGGPPEICDINYEVLER